MKPYWKQLAGAFIALVGVTASQLAVPTILRNVIDTGLLKGEVQYMLSAALIILAIGVGRAVLSTTGRYLSETVSMRFAYDLRNRLFNHIQNQSFSYHDRAQTGQLMSRCTEDIRSMQAFTGTGFVALLQIVLLIFGSLALMLNENVRLTLITLAPLVPLMVITIGFGGRVSKLFYAIDKNLGELSARLQENVTGVQVVRAFTRETHEIKRFDDSNRSLFDARIHVINEWSKIMPTTMFLVSLSTITLLWFGGNMVINGDISVGQVVQFNSYMLLIALPARQLTWYVNIAGEAAAGAQRTIEVLEHEPEITSPENAYRPDTLRGEVTFENVTFTYQGEEKPALQGINFSTELDNIKSDSAGSNLTIGLIGPTGSGKTTFVNLLPRFYQPSEGRVLIDGVDVQEYDLEFLRSQIGYVLQTTLLFTTTIHENIAFGRPNATSEEVIEAAKSAMAHEFILSFPDGYDTLVGERGITLSGGQRQRIAIARALLINPRILVLDDSTSSVDTETEHAIQQALKNLMKNRTTFIITQRISSIRDADRILVFEQGRIVERGNHQNLLEKAGAYARIHKLQLSQQEQAIQELETSSGKGGSNA